MSAIKWIFHASALTAVFCHRDYEETREKLLQIERANSLGGGIGFTEAEAKVNAMLLLKKHEELESAYRNGIGFSPSLPFPLVVDEVRKSAVYGIIRTLPKGGNLHTHILASVSVDYIVENVTYKDGLYACNRSGDFKMRFFPMVGHGNVCEWISLKDIRRKDQAFDTWLKDYLTVGNQATSKVWSKFKRMFRALYDALAYRPVFEDILQRSLLELHEDNVAYVEYRGNLMELYESNGTLHDSAYFLGLFKKTADKFASDHADFFGARYIYSLPRDVDAAILRSRLEMFKRLREQYSSHLLGIDFVGFEDGGKPLVDFADVLAENGAVIKYFFHAGETKWFGFTDENLIDAVLLNATRLGHALSLIKHPEVIRMVKERDIGIEVCPLSNQVLMSVGDLRDHPAAAFFAQNLPIVVCNDDPSFWKASGLSFDWYAAFMSMTSKNAGLEVLKQLANNSIRYSALLEIEKKAFYKKWEVRWSKFLDGVLKD